MNFLSRLPSLALSTRVLDVASSRARENPNVFFRRSDHSCKRTSFFDGFRATLVFVFFFAANPAQLGAAEIDATYTTESDVPLSTAGYIASGNTVNFTLNYAPVPGTRLTVVRNTGLTFIQGELANLANGNPVNLNFDGKTYYFVAWYYGGDGNDLVLVPRDTGLAAWGYNSAGQLGDNSYDHHAVPKDVDRSGILAGKTIVSITAGSHHSLALCSDGTLAAWGYNEYGQLGDGSNSIRNSPVLVDRSGALSGKTIVAIAAGFHHSLALCSDGSIAGWGWNGSGQLGDNSNSHRNAPVLVDQSGVLAGKVVVAVSAGIHSLALCSDGTLAAWGWNKYGQLGDDSTIDRNVPVVVDQSGVLSGKTVVKVAAGRDHSLALCSDGTFASWGWNEYGQLGDGSTIDRNVPVSVDQSGVLSGKSVVSVVAGDFHSLALCSDGTLAAWGYNHFGVLGNNTTTDSAVPVLVDQGGVLASKSVTTLSAGAGFSSVLCTDGTLAAWGFNGYGQLGDNSDTDRHVPVDVTQGGVLADHSLFGLASDGNGHHSLALFEATSEIAVEQPATSILTYGDATIDFGPAGIISSTVERVFTIRNSGGAPLRNIAITFDGTDAADFSVTSGPAAEVAPGGSTTFTVRFVPSNTGTKSATLHLASNDEDMSPFDISVTGTGVVPEIIVEQPVGINLTDGSSTIEFGTDVYVGSVVEKSFTVRNAGSGSLTGFGFSFTGTGADDYSIVAAPASEIAPGDSTTFSVRFVPSTDGTRTAVMHFANNDADESPFDIYLTGTGVSTALQASYTTGREIPLTSLGFSGSGSTVNFTLNENLALGTVLTVVDNIGQDFIQGEFDNLVNGSFVDLTHESETYSFVVWYYGGDGNDLVLIPRNSGLAAWGGNFHAQLGDGSYTNRKLPVAVDQSGVLAGKAIVSVSAGESHNLALCSDGSIASWGYNGYGQLGDGSTTARDSPVLVDQSGVLAGKTVISVVAGFNYSLVLCKDGTLAAWGANFSGHLGDNTTTNRRIPVLVDRSGVLAGKTVVKMSAGWVHSLALCSDGTLVTWGGYSAGQTFSAPLLVDQSGVLADKSIVTLSTGRSHHLALCSDGSIAAWGGNGHGQLGDGSTTSRDSAVLVDQSGVLAGKTVVAVAAGKNHSLALCSDNTIASWGMNFFYQLGDSTNTDRNAPVLVDQGGVLAGKDIIAVSATESHNLALCADGTLAAWGSDFYGQFGDGPSNSTNSFLLVDQSAILESRSVFRLASQGAGVHSLVAFEATSEIAVEHPDGSDLTSGVSTIDFDTSELPLVERTITIRNRGGAPLTGLAESLDGPDASDFSIILSPTPEVPPFGSTSATVRFAPSTIGEKSATLLLVSNDSDENPFEITLSGSSNTFNATFSNGNEVPLTDEGFTATGFSVDLILDYAPTPGTILTVVNNTSTNFIEGEFDNLPHGSVVFLDYMNTTYEFIAWYTGGEDGNDLVLLWRDGSLASLWSTDSDTDGIPWGVEHALGTNADISDLGDPAHYRGPIFSPGGAATVTFGRNPNAEGHTIWLLLRSTDLSPDSFQEIYRFDGTTQAETKLPGITSILNGDSISIIDTNPPPDRAFYQFVPVYTP